MATQDDLLETQILDERFGWAPEKRTKTLEAAHSEIKTNPGPTFPVRIKGRLEHRPILRVPIELPRYRLNNGRTKSSQKEFLSTHTSLSPTLFTSDEELTEAQKAQHEILLTHAHEADLRKYFSDPTNEQEEPILLTNNGFVLNGNRRLSVWRQLFYSDKPKYPHLRYIQVVWLEHLLDDELFRIERELQVQRGLKSDYMWHARAQMIEEARNLLNLNDEEIVNDFGLEKDSDVAEQIGILKLARSYLDTRGRHDKWSSINKSEWGFRALYNHLKGINNPSHKDVLRELTFSLIEGTDTSTRGSIWTKVRDLKNNLPYINQRIREDHVVDGGADTNVVGNNSQPEWDDLFGNPAPDDQPDSALSNIMLDQSRREEVLESALDEVESQKSREKESKDANYLITLASKANSNLSNLRMGLTSDRKLDGLEAQLIEIESNIVEIRKWIESNAQS